MNDVYDEGENGIHKRSRNDSTRQPPGCTSDNCLEGSANESNCVVAIILII